MDSNPKPIAKAKKGLVRNPWSTIFPRSHHAQPSNTTGSMAVLVGAGRSSADKRQQIPPLHDLKRLLKTSRRPKFLDVCPVNSAINGRWNARLDPSDPRSIKRASTVKCWVFEVPKR